MSISPNLADMIRDYEDSDIMVFAEDFKVIGIDGYYLDKILPKYPKLFCQEIQIDSADRPKEDINESEEETNSLVCALLEAFEGEVIR